MQWIKEWAQKYKRLQHRKKIRKSKTSIKIEKRKESRQKTKEISEASKKKEDLIEININILRVLLISILDTALAVSFFAYIFKMSSDSDHSRETNESLPEIRVFL